MEKLIEKIKVTMIEKKEKKNPVRQRERERSPYTISSFGAPVVVLEFGDLENPNPATIKSFLL